MTTSAGSLLKTIQFKQTEKWYVEYYLNQKTIISRYPQICMSHIIRPRKDRVKLGEYEDVVPIVGKIRFSDGQVFFREKREPKGDLYLSKIDDLIVSNINFEKGAFTLNTFGDTATSTDYQPYEIIYDDINKEYLLIVLRSDVFLDNVKSMKPSGMKVRARYDFIGRFGIPIPPLDVQKQLVDEYKAEICSSDACNKEADEIEQNINSVLFRELGINYGAGMTESGGALLKTVQLAQFRRWSVDYLLNQSSTAFIQTSKYDVVPARAFIKECQYGLSLKASTVPTGIPMLRMNNIQNSELNVTDLKYLSEDTGGLSNYTLNKGDLLFNRTNSKELVGKTALFNLDEKYVFASYLIRVVIDEGIADAAYVNIMFASRAIRSQVDLISRQVLGQANINAEEMKELLFPLPPINIQKEIVRKVMNMKAEVRFLRRQATDYRNNAKSDFEKAVYGE